MNLQHVVSIRHSNNFPVVSINIDDVYTRLKEDIEEGKKHHRKIAIITKNHKEAHYIYHLLKDDFPTINYLTETSEIFNHDLVIVYTDKDNKYKDDEKNLYYVVVTRAQHQLKVYNQE